MKINVSNLNDVLSEYFDDVIVPASVPKGSLHLFGTSFISGILKRNFPIMLEQYLPLAHQVGLVDSDNNLDIDLLYEEATKAMNKGKPTILGYTMDQSDLDKLREFMYRRAS